MKKRDIFADFAEAYLDRLVECLAEGAQGGIYHEKILVTPGREGVFKAKDLKTFIRFQHGDNDYDYEYGNRGDAELQDNPKKLAKALLKALDDKDKKHDWDSVQQSMFPSMEDNIRESLKKIIKG